MTATEHPPTSKNSSPVLSEPSLQHFFSQYLTLHAQPYKKSWQEDVAQFRRYLHHWADRPLSSITPTEVQQQHVTIGHQNGLTAANRLLSLLKVLFNKAIEWGYPVDNPTRRIKKFPEKSRQRFIQAHEFPALFQALEESHHANLQDYVLISLYTGARKSNVLSMRWEHIDWSSTVWRIPETKNGDPHAVPLVKAALAILTRRQSNGTASPWVFPSPYRPHNHWACPQKAWKKLCQRAGLNDLRLHDIRRSTASWEATTGASLVVIAKTLAHKNMNTTQIYARLNLQPVREALEKATTAMIAAAHGNNLPPASNPPPCPHCRASNHREW